MKDGGSDETDVLSIPENLGPRLMGLTSSSDDGDDTLTYVSSSIQISSDPSLVAHGRGLITSHDIRAGDLLFVHPPTVRAEISKVLRLHQNKAESKNSKNLLESIAETVLLKEMKRAIRGRTKQKMNARIAASFLALNCSHSNDKQTKNPEKDNQCLLRILLGKGTSEDIDQFFERLQTVGESFDDNDSLLGIIRHNAFGPDFHNYDRMKTELQTNNSNDRSNTSADSLYARILGHYPLAAMINHSCGPTNAARVFYGEVMVASATRDIPEGSEIRWPYCPPTLPCQCRSEQLAHVYHFQCECQRCRFEEHVFGTTDGETSSIPSPPTIPKGLNDVGNSSNVVLDLQQWSKILKSLDIWYTIVATKLSSSGTKQTLGMIEGLRLGYTQLYFRYFNQALLQQESKATILAEATKLHRSFREIHNASTEHLSLVHLCYELSTTTARESVRLWTENLKDVHTCRYSNAIVGKDIATLREVLKHTRTVLRTSDGWKTNDFSTHSEKTIFL